MFYTFSIFGFTTLQIMLLVISEDLPGKQQYSLFTTNIYFGSILFLPIKFSTFVTNSNANKQCKSRCQVQCSLARCFLRKKKLKKIYWFNSMLYILPQCVYVNHIKDKGKWENHNCWITKWYAKWRKNPHVR